MSKTDDKDAIPNDNLDRSQKKPNESHQLFTVDPDKSKYYYLPHNLEEEKRVIFEDKLLVQLSPPFESSFWDIIAKQDNFTTTYESKLRFDKIGITIAINEETIPIDTNTYIEPVLQKLQEKREQLYKESRELATDINNKKTRRIYAATAAQNAITASRTEDRLSAQDSRQQGFYAQKRDSNVIDVKAKEIGPRAEGTRLPSKLLSKGVPLSPSTKPPSKELRTSGSLLTKDTQSNVGATNWSTLVGGLNSDILIVENQLRRSLAECRLVEEDIKQLEDSIKNQNHKNVYRFKIGQIIPDNAENLIHCYYCNALKKCENCSLKENCDTLVSHKFFDVFSYYTKNMLDLSDTVKHAKDDFGIDFDNPMKMIDRHAPVPFEHKIDFHVWDFKNENGKTIMLVQDIVEDESIVTHSGVMVTADIPPEIGFFLPSIPLAPAKLLNIPDIWKKTKYEVFFTDCLEFTHYAKPTDNTKIITSYYGGQFGNVEVDFFPLRNRSVHYLIFEYPRVPLNEAIKKACHNYQQMKEYPGLNVDFYFIKPQMNNDSTPDGFTLEGKLTAEEFCNQYRQYMDNPNTEPTKSNSSASSQDKSNENAKESEMLLGPLIEKGKYILLAGGKHSGKTTLAVSIAASVASGNEIVQILRPERHIEKGVLFLNFELPKPVFEKHKHPIINSISKKQLKDIPLYIEHMQQKVKGLNPENRIEIIKETISAFKDKIDMLILDNITAISRESQKDNVEWNENIGPYIIQLNEVGMTVIVIAHWERGDVVGGRQKLRNAQECILLEKASPVEESKENNENQTKFVSKNIMMNVSKPFHMTSFPFPEENILLTLNERAQKLQWKFGNQYLEDILKSDYSAEEIAEWFNTTPKTVREWWKKLFPGTKRKRS